MRAGGEVVTWRGAAQTQLVVGLCVFEHHHSVMLQGWNAKMVRTCSAAQTLVILEHDGDQALGEVTCESVHRTCRGSNGERGIRGGATDFEASLEL